MAVTIAVVPPLVLGEATPRTYALAAAIVILAVGATLPYALFVGIGTLPFLYAGFASYSAPQPSSETRHSFSLSAILRHVVGGVVYSLGAAAVGAIGLGAQFGIRDATIPGTIGGQPLFLPLGGVIVGTTFVALQLWRYDNRRRALDQITLLGTAALGLLVAVSPLVAFWVFRNGA